MSKSYIQLTKNIEIYLGCVCGQCETTRLILLDVKIITEKSYIFNRLEAEKGAESNAYLAQEKLMEVLNQITQQKMDLCIGKIQLSVGEDEIPASIILKGIDTLCPVCGHKEPWQIPSKSPEYSSASISSIDQHHMPHAWVDITMATNWAVAASKKALERKQEYWTRYPSRKRMLLDERAKICSLIDLIDDESNSFSELKSRNEIQKKNEELEKKRTELRGEERKNVIKEIKRLNDNVQNINLVIEEKNLAYNSVKSELISQKEAIQLQLVGAEGVINAEAKDRNIWWQLF